MCWPGWPRPEIIQESQQPRVAMGADRPASPIYTRRVGAQPGNSSQANVPISAIGPSGNSVYRTCQYDKLLAILGVRRMAIRYPVGRRQLARPLLALGAVTALAAVSCTSTSSQPSHPGGSGAIKQGGVYRVGVTTFGNTD